MIQTQMNYPKCECHDCTQARWKMSFQGQLAGQVPDQSNSTLKAIQQQQHIDSAIGKVVDQFNAKTKVGFGG